MIFINLLANNVRKENKMTAAVAILHDTMVYFKYTYRYTHKKSPEFNKN